MRLFVAVTDWDWFRLHASKPSVEEVNFWRPSPDATFKALQLGEPLLFKLHAPRNYIAGGGFFAKYVQLPLRMAWEALGDGNGVRSLDECPSRKFQPCDRTPVPRCLRTVREPVRKPSAAVSRTVARITDGIYEMDT